MKYIKGYNNYVNESLLGNLIKGIKNKFSLSVSKMFGSAVEIAKLMDSYKKERMTKMIEKKAAINKYTDYIKSLKSGEEKDQDKINQLVEDIKKATLNFDKQSDLIRKKFNIKFDEIIDEEKNKKVRNYVNLKKIEMEQELLNNEISLLLTDSGLTEEDRKNNPELNNLLNQIEIKLKKAEEMEQKEIANLKAKEETSENKGEVINKFDLNKAKELASKTPQEKYLWKDSPYLNTKFENGDKINYFSMSNRDSTSARVVQDLGQELNIRTESGNQIKIKKSAVIEKL